MNSLALDQVTFSYPNSPHLVFDQASIRINQGDKLALVGKSRIGKSTVIKLLMRYFDASLGLF